MANKILNLRLWEKESKPWNASVMDMQYQLLIVSQFTLYTNLKGNRPDFHAAMPPAEGKITYNTFVDLLKRKYNASKIQEGEYGADMEVQLVNDGPITITIDSEVDTDLSRAKAKEQKAAERYKGKNNKVDTQKCEKSASSAAV
jgi:D-tyrosyl-tRNA(Tyr) deacylase